MICQPCQCVVFDAQVNRHLRLHHKSQGLAETQFLPREVLSYFQQFPQRVRSAEELVIPSTPVTVVPFLSVYQDTFQCGESSCRWIGRGLHRIQEHYRLQHGWKAPPVSERPTAVPPWAPILSQQFIPRGPGSQRFAVLPSPTGERHTHNLPGRASTPLSSPPVASQASVANPELQDSANRRCRTNWAPSCGQTATFTPESTPQAVLHDLPAPQPSTQVSSSSSVPLAVASNPSVHPDKCVPTTPKRIARSPSWAPGSATVEGDWPDGQGSTTPAPHTESPEDLLLQWLEDRARDCPLCLAGGLFPSARTHPLESCPGANAELIRQESAQLLQRIDIRSRSCWGCGLPQSFCDQFQGRSYDAKVLTPDRTCYAPRIMAPTIICTGIFDTRRFEIILGLIHGGDQIDLEDSEKAYQWFAQESPFLSIVATRVTQVFYQLHSTRSLPVD